MVNRTQTSMPCPAWCDREPGHPFDLRSTELGTVVRIHEHGFGEHVSICCKEHAISDDGPTWQHESPQIELDCEEYHLDLPDARLTLVEFRRAVEFLEGLS